MSANELDDLFNAPPARPVMATNDDIMAHLKWSTPKEVQTKNGPRLLSQAVSFPEFNDYWRDHGRRLASEGYSFGEWKGKWTVCHWEKLPEKIVVERKAAIEMSRATDADINVPCPDGLAYLGYQRAGIAFGHTRPGVLIGDEMGLGKTIQAIGLINAAPDARRILIICPASLKLNWKRELEKWLTDDRTIFISDGKIFPEIDGIIVINYDVLHKHEDVIKGTEWDMVIVDEAHFLKNPKSRRGKMIFGLEATKKEKDRGAADIPGIDSKKRVLLTGTPICNKPVELWPLIHYLDPINWGNFFRYAIRYCAANQNGHGWDFSGASNLNELQEKLRSTCFPGDTLIATEHGTITIEQLVSRKIRCRVWSRNRMGCISLKPIVGWSETKNRRILVEILHESGSFRCTPDHRIFTSKGYIRAGKLEVGDCLLSMRNKNRKDNFGSIEPSQAGQPLVLFNHMRRNTASKGSERSIQNHQGEKTNSDSKALRTLRESIHCSERERISAETVLHGNMQGGMDIRALCRVGNCIAQSRGPKNTRTETAKAENQKARPQESVLATSSHEEQLTETSHDLPPDATRSPSIKRGLSRRSDGIVWKGNLCGHPNTEYENCDRSRWIRSREDCEQEERSGTRPGTAWSRILSIQSVELGHHRKSPGSNRKDSSVFDIEVAENHNFFAEGILAHNCMIRRLKKDVLTELPPKRRQVIELTADACALRAIKAELAVFSGDEDEMEQMQARVELAKASDSPGEFEAAVRALETRSKAVFTEIAKLRHDTTMAKLPACIEHLKDAVEESEKVVCFAHHKDAVKAIKEAFGDAAVTLVGDDAMADRQASVDRFQKDPTCKLFIGSIGAAGVGITLTAAAHVVMVELDWVPGNVSQAEDRCHRIGQRESVLVQHLVLEGSLDAVMAKRIIAKQDVIDRALDKPSNEPIAGRSGYATAGTTRVQLSEEAIAMTEDQCAAAHTAIRLIAGHCNGAKNWDGAGFSKIDVTIGHSLAGQDCLSRKQAALARKIALKYRRQLPDSLHDRLK